MTIYKYKRETRNRVSIDTPLDDIKLNYIAVEKLEGSVMNFIFSKRLPTGKVWITDRDINGGYDADINYNYPASVRKIITNLAHNLDKNLQYIEVGAGLGELIPKLIGAQIDKRPIVIDPAPYGIMQEMLEYILQLVEIQTHHERCLKLIERAKLMQDQDKVNLINLTLKDALDQHPEIKGIGNILIDNYGGVTGSTSKIGNRPDDILNLEAQLLKEKGRLYIQNYSLIKINGKLESQK